MLLRGNLNELRMKIGGDERESVRFFVKIRLRVFVSSCLYLTLFDTICHIP